MIFFILLLQNQTAESPFEKWLYALGSSAFTALLAYLAVKRQAKANAGKTEVEIVGDWQEKYFSLLDKLEGLRDKSKVVEDELDEAKRELRKCLNSKGDCKEMSGKINGIFIKTENALKDLIEHAPLLAEIQKMRVEIEEM